MLDPFGSTAYDPMVSNSLSGATPLAIFSAHLAADVARISMGPACRISAAPHFGIVAEVYSFRPSPGAGRGRAGRLRARRWRIRARRPQASGPKGEIGGNRLRTVRGLARNRPKPGPQAREGRASPRKNGERRARQFQSVAVYLLGSHKEPPQCRPS